MPAEKETQRSASAGVTEQGINTINQLVGPWFDFVRTTLDATEVNVVAFCDHARELAQARTPSDVVKIQTTYVRSALQSSQEQAFTLLGLVRRGRG